MEERKLYRSRGDRMIGGVCGGIASYFGLDPTVVRLLAVVLTLVGNAAVVVAYIVMWAVVPEEPITVGQTAPTVPVPSSVVGVDSPTPVSSAPVPGSPAAAVSASVAPAPPVASAGHAGEVARGFMWVGVILVLIGVAFLVRRFTAIGIAFWPMAFVGVLFVVLGVKTMFTKEDDR